MPPAASKVSDFEDLSRWKGILDKRNAVCPPRQFGSESLCDGWQDINRQSTSFAPLPLRLSWEFEEERDLDQIGRMVEAIWNERPFWLAGTERLPVICRQHNH